MKKIICVVLSVLMVVACFAITGCNQKPQAEETLKFGSGVYAVYEEPTNADGDTLGTEEIVANAAAVLLDKDGKIVKCVLDSIICKVSFNSAGEAQPAAEYKTKYEQGADYGMAKFGQDANGDGVVKEWNEQADAFCNTVVGKTIDEAKALVVDGYKAGDELAKAGCTIAVSDFIKVLERAVANATDSDATADDTLALSIIAAQSKATNATDEAAGSIGVDIDVAAAVIADGKAVVLASDSFNPSVKFDANGVCTTEKGEIVSKKNLGENYNMAKFGQDANGDGVVKEWNEQAAAFDAACIGKTADEIAALALEDGYGVDTLKTAGCTIAVSNLVACAVKVLK